MNDDSVELLLADDDTDDCLLFKETIEEYPIPTNLTIVNNGEQLLKLLIETEKLPSVIFLDLNMPRKNGFESLTEIKLNERLKNIPVIIISTSYNKDVVSLLYEKGASYYIRKPNEYEKLKEAVHHALSFALHTELLKPTLQDFVLNS